jgi:hypothetical protein
MSPATVGVAGIGMHMCNQSQAFAVILWWQTVVLNICLTQFRLQPFTRAVMNKTVGLGISQHCLNSIKIESYLQNRGAFRSFIAK